MAVDENDPLWLQQCEAACNIQFKYGTMKALGYLIGEKFINFLYLGKNVHGYDPKDRTHFVAAIKERFEQWEIRAYFKEATRVGATGHVLSDADFEEVRKRQPDLDDPELAAQQAIYFEKAKALLLDDPDE